MRHFSPDDYLETPNGRVYTAELNAAAWEHALADLRRHLVQSAGSFLYVVTGAQAARKTTWINANAQRLGERACFFDAQPIAREARSYERVIRPAL